MAATYVLVVNKGDASWELMRGDLYASLPKVGMPASVSYVPLERVGLTQEVARDYLQAAREYDDYYASRGPRMSDEEQVRADTYELKMKDLEKVIEEAVAKVR